MPSIFLLFFTSLIVSMTVSGEAYICNLDYYEKISNSSSAGASLAVTVILFSKDCQAGKKATYHEKIGGIDVEIICQDDIRVIIGREQQKTIRHTIRRQDYYQRFQKSYVSNSSGLQISCQGRTLGRPVVSF